MTALRRAALALLLALHLPVGCSGSDRVYSFRLNVDREFQLESWRQAEIGGFVVSTNVPEPEARSLLRKLSRFLDLIDVALSERSFETTRARRLFLFREGRQFQAFGGNAGGHAISGGEALTIGFSVESGTDAVPILFHELVHIALFEDADFDYPSWYHEGMGELLGTAVFRENVAVLGRIPLKRVSALEKSEPLDLQTLFDSHGTWQLEGEDVGRFYADSWAMVRFLHGGIGPSMPSYHRSMLRFVGLQNAKLPWRQAFAESFDVSLDEFERQFAEFRKGTANGVSHVHYVELPSAVPEIRFESLSKTEAALRLGSYAGAANAFRLSAAFYDLALSRDSGNMGARTDRAVVLASLGFHQRASQDLAAIDGEFRESAVAANAHARVFMARHHALEESERASVEAAELLASARLHFRDAIQKDPTHSDYWAGLAEGYALDRRSDAREGLEALESVRRSMRSSLRLDLTRARLLARLERQTEAREILESMLAAVHKGQLADQARDLLQELGPGAD